MAPVTVSKPELIHGKSYTPCIDPEFAKYQEKYGLILNSVLFTDICIEDNGRALGISEEELISTRCVKLAKKDIIKHENIELKKRKKCLKHLNGLVNWSTLKRKGLVALKLKNKAIKNSQSNISKKGKLDNIIGITSRKIIRSSPRRKVLPPPSKLNNNDKVEIFKKPKRPTIYADRPDAFITITSEPSTPTSKANRQPKSNNEKKNNHFFSPKLPKPSTAVDLKKSDDKPIIFNPLVIPNSTFPSTTTKANNYKIPKVKRKKEPIDDVKEPSCKNKTNVSIFDPEYHTILWKSDSDSDDEVEPVKIPLIPDPTFEEMTCNLAYVTFSNLLAHPEEKSVDPPLYLSLEEIISLTRDDYDENPKVVRTNFNSLKSVGQKVAWWVSYDEESSEYPHPPFECPELEEDLVSSISIGDDDDISDVDDIFSDEEIDVECDVAVKAKGPLIDLEYAGNALVQASRIGVNERNVGLKYFNMLNVTSGTNYERASFKVQCMICELHCPSVQDLALHLKSELHRSKFSQFSFELATEEEKSYAETIDFDELKKVRRERRRQVRREFKATYEEFFVPEVPTIERVYSLSDNNQSTTSSNNFILSAEDFVTAGPPGPKRKRLRIDSDSD